MTLLFCDGFDQYAVDADLADKWDTAATGGLTWGATKGKDGTQGGVDLEGQLNESTTSPMEKWFPASVPGDIVRVAFWMKHANLTGSWEFLALLGGSELYPLHQVQLGWNSTNFTVARQSNVLATSSNTFSNATWYHMEWEVLIDSSAGTTKLWVDGVEEINATGLNTSGIPRTESAMGVALGTFSASYIVTIDDLVVWNDVGSGMTAAMGEDHQIDVLVPDGAGNTTAWTSTGTNWSEIDETGAHTAASYNHSTTATNKDTFSYGDMLDDPATIWGVQLNTVLATGNTPTTPRGFHLVCRAGTTDYDYTDDWIMADAVHRNSFAIWDLNPDTSSAWDTAGVDAAEFGYELDV